MILAFLTAIEGVVGRARARNHFRVEPQVHDFLQRQFIVGSGARVGCAASRHARPAVVPGSPWIRRIRVPRYRSTSRPKDPI
jgi:hypothetical protein